MPRKHYTVGVLVTLDNENWDDDQPHFFPSTKTLVIQEN